MADTPNPVMPPPVYINPKDPSAMRQATNIMAAQFQDWQSFFQPIELQAMQQLSFNNPSVLTNAVNEAETAATGAYGAMPGIEARENRAIGVNPTKQQGATSKRLIDLNKALATAGAADTARAGIEAQDEAILYGTAPGNAMSGGLGVA